MLERRDTGKKGFKEVGMWERRDAGKEGYGKVGIQGSRYLGKERCWKGRRKKEMMNAGKEEC